MAKLMLMVEKESPKRLLCIFVSKSTAVGVLIRREN